VNTPPWIRSWIQLVREQRRARLWLVLGLSVLAIGGIEGCLRLFAVAPLAAPAGEFRNELSWLGLPEPERCTSTGKLDGPFFVEVCTNRLGLRDRDHAPGEAPRVLVLGDSFTFGAGVEQAETFSSILERELRVAVHSTRAGVFNAGVISTSQAHQAVLIHRLFDQIDPDIVVLGFSEEDDIDENIFKNPSETPAGDHYRGALRPRPVDFLSRHSATVRLFRHWRLYESMAAEAAAVEQSSKAHGTPEGAPDVVDAGVARRRFLQAFGRQYDGDWRVTEILLERIQRFVAERGKKLVLLRIPSRVSIEDPRWASASARFCGSDRSASAGDSCTSDRSYTARRLWQHAKAGALVYIDPESELRAALAGGKAVYLPEDIHLNRLGHAIVGKRLVEVLAPYLGGKFEASTAPPASPIQHRRVGAYWYPWYRATDWSSITDYSPKGGAYLSTDASAIRRQLHWAEQGELDFLMIELLADHNPESQFNNRAVSSMVDALSERRRRGHSQLKFAMLSDISLANADIVTIDRWLDESKKHLDQIWTRFVEPYPDAYLHVDGKPLVGIFSPPAPIDDPRFTVIRPYWVAHEQWRDWDRKQELLPFWDTYPQAVTDRRFMSVVPGYNDWRLERHPQVAPHLPRLGGHTFAEQWSRVFEVAPELVLVYSFNEYFEQTQIEPTLEQGDRYLVLNQIFARRFKDGRRLGAGEAARLVEALEPPARSTDEKVSWLPVFDDRVTHRGLEDVGNGRAAFRDQAELEFDVRSEGPFIVGVGHAPSFDRCTGLSVTVVGAGEEKARTFSGELSQLSILRDLPLPKTVERLKLRLRRIAGASDCSDAAKKPILVTGIARYPFSAVERLTFDVADRRVSLEGFWDVETPPSGPFAWSGGSSTIKLSNLTPGVRHRVTLILRDTGNFDSIEMGTDPRHLKRVAITPARTATFPDPVGVSPGGTLEIVFKSGRWKPRERFGSEDPRTLGVALRLITLDRVDGAKPDRQQ
jgi:hypothetical protein